MWRVNILPINNLYKIKYLLLIEIFYKLCTFIWQPVINVVFVSLTKSCTNRLPYECNEFQSSPNSVHSRYISIKLLSGIFKCFSFDLKTSGKLLMLSVIFHNLHYRYNRFDFGYHIYLQLIVTFYKMFVNDTTYMQPKAFNDLSTFQWSAMCQFRCFQAIKLLYKIYKHFGTCC